MGGEGRGGGGASRVDWKRSACDNLQKVGVGVGVGVDLHTASRLKEPKTPSGTNLHSATVQYLQQSIMEI